MGIGKPVLAPPANLPRAAPFRRSTSEEGERGSRKKFARYYPATHRKLASSLFTGAAVRSSLETVEYCCVVHHTDSL